MKHTEGKWYPVDYAGTFIMQANPIYGDPDLFDYNEFHENCLNKEEAKANVFLASKAPEMYEALKELYYDSKIFKGDYSTKIIVTNDLIIKIGSLLKSIES